MASWNSTAVKTHLRLTVQRLAQLQERADSQAGLAKRNLANLLQNGSTGLARTKAEKMMHQDITDKLLELLEMHTGQLLEHFSEMEHSKASPTVLEAASTILHASPHLDSPELKKVCDILAQHFGVDFVQGALTGRNVSSRILNVLTLSAASPTTEQVDAYLLRIAETHGVQWVPDPTREDIINNVSMILDPDSSPIVDLDTLRELCRRGIPDEPKWLRPRVWKLFFGVLPASKTSWAATMKQHRSSYYELVKRILDPIAALPLPEDPLLPSDESLQRISQGLSRVPSLLFKNLEDLPTTRIHCPLDDDAPDEIRIPASTNLDDRLKLIQDAFSTMSDAESVPEIHLEESQSGEYSESKRARPTLLLSARTYTAGNAHPKHASALLRLLYLHSSINPGNMSSHIPQLLVPLYTALYQDPSAEEVAHVEADTFWLLEALVGEVSELEDEREGVLWMKKLSERLSWADHELWENLHMKSLDPGLPHYSYQWMAPLLTQTLPLESVIVAWDALFSNPMRERNHNAKLEFLLDICVAMLLRARTVLFRLGKPGRRASGLWRTEALTPPASPIRTGELNDAFHEGVVVLAQYNIRLAGGIDAVLQTATELTRRRILEEANVGAGNLGIGARLRVNMWKGIAGQTASGSSEQGGKGDDGAEQDNGLAPPSLTSRFANTVWRGITNQSAMDALDSPPSPISPVSPAPTPPTATPLTPTSPPSTSGPQANGLWDYAEKLKQSDTAATFSKVSSNWRAKAMFSSWGRKSLDTEPVTETAKTLPPLPNQHRDSEPPRKSAGHWEVPAIVKRNSLPRREEVETYSPPPRPSHFRQPRDSGLFHSRSPSLLSSRASSPEPDVTEFGLAKKAQSLQASLASLTGVPTTPETKTTGPRPLLLSSSTLFRTGHQRVDSLTTERLAEGSNLPERTRRDSLGSVSSLAPSDAIMSPRTDGGDSEHGAPRSRKVMLNRKSVSPMAPHYRAMSISSSGYSSERQNALDSPSYSRATLPYDIPPMPSPPPKTPSSLSSPHEERAIRISDTEQQRGSVVIDEEQAYAGLEPPLQPKKLVRKKTPPRHYRSDTSDSAADVPSVGPRLRSKRYAKPTNLRLQQEQSRDQPSMLQVVTDLDPVITPKASSFESEVSGASPSRRRKVSTSSRQRKFSSESRETVRRRDSAGEKGDDEGYDDLLSAYESEDGAMQASLR